MEESDNKIDSLSQKVIKVVGISILMILLTLLILYGFKVILLILAGLIFSIFFRGIAIHLRSWFHLNEGFSLFFSILLVLGILISGFILLWPSLSEQIQSLQEEIPHALNKAKQSVQGSLLGDFAIDRINQISGGEESGMKNIQKKALGFFNTAFGVVGDLYIIFFLGIFFMVQPALYRKGIVTLFSKARRKRANEVLLTIAYTLKRWLLGAIFTFALEWILTSIGLGLLGIPMALALGFFTGLMTFIPNFGPIIAFIPAALLASVQGMDQVIYVAFLYIGIQTLESNLITPLIQKNMILFPMAAILIAQVLLALFTGALGIILAVPIVAIIMVMVKMTYVEDILQDKSVKVVGEDKFKK